MHLSGSWYALSCFAFVVATLSLLTAGFVFLSVLGKLSPLLQDTHDEIQDLGDIAANTVGYASDAMDIVELRVSETLAQVETGAKTATNKVLGVGTALAGVYLASRFFGILRGAVKHRSKPKPFWRKLF